MTFEKYLQEKKETIKGFNLTSDMEIALEHFLDITYRTGKIAGIEEAIRTLHIHTGECENSEINECICENRAIDQVTGDPF